MRTSNILFPLFAALLLAACGKSDPATESGSTAGSESATQEAPAKDISAEAFITRLALPESLKESGQRQAPDRRGKSAYVFTLDMQGMTVREADAQLAKALKAEGFKRGKVTRVPGGVRVSYQADDRRKASTLIRNKQYLKDRAPAGSTGQVSLSYILPPGM